MKADDCVRLVEALDDVPAGAVGVVLGFCRTPEGEGVAVQFGADGRVVAPDDLELVEPAPAYDAPALRRPSSPSFRPASP